MNLFVFRGEDLSKEIFLNPELANIVISSELKEQYEDKLSLINDKMDRIKEIVTLNILEGKLGRKHQKQNIIILCYSLVAKVCWKE